MVKVKSMHTIKPATETPTGLMYVSEFDEIMPLTHVSTVYFYRPSNQSFAGAVEIIKSSLSKALVIFYPLAGRLRPAARGRHHLHCNSAGALLVEAESVAKIDDFGDFCPSPEMRALVPSVDYTQPIEEQPLLVVQLTKFSCGGFSLGLGMLHALADGLAAAHFISEWARIARGEQPLDLPFLDRTILQPEEGLRPPAFDHSDLKTPPPLIGQSESDISEETKVALFKLSEEQIEQLRKIANDYEENNKNKRGFTRFQAVAAHVWRCACKARHHRNEQPTSLRIVVNFRRRVEPSLPDFYFGNAVLPVYAGSTAGELMWRPLGYGCGKIREAIDKVTTEYVRSFQAYLKNEANLGALRYAGGIGGNGVPFGNPNIRISNWTGVKLSDGCDFGWGKEIHFGLVSLASEGHCLIFPAKGGDGGNASIVIALRLQKAFLDTFNLFFYEDI